MLVRLTQTVLLLNISLVDCVLECQNGNLSLPDCTCQCNAGFTGSECETNIDDCLPNPCQNGGNCSDGINMYTCMCAEDFEGENCTDYNGRCLDNYLTGKLIWTHETLSSIPVC